MTLDMRKDLIIFQYHLQGISLRLRQIYNLSRFL